MGNYCFEDPRGTSLNGDGSTNIKQVIIQPLSHQMPNSVVLSELRSLPPISKNILNRMQELGPFVEDHSKNLGKIYQLKNKSIYQGQLKNKLFHGHGRLFLNDGSIIQSKFQNGQLHGTTRIFKTNGDYYVGIISNNKEKEPGIVYEKGIKYEGDLLNQKPHGYGNQTSKNYTFSGTYQNGKKINGLLRWNLENPKYIQEYQGAFVDNLFQGQGSLQNHQGKYQGNFQKGQKSGFGVQIWASGKRYEGNFLRNKPNGLGKFYNQNGDLVSQGNWLNGKLQVTENLQQII